jgi:hypothetical protein
MKRFSVVTQQAVLMLGCLAIALGARTALTALMSLHMLVQIPLLLACGLFAEQAWFACHGSHCADQKPMPPARGWSWNDYGVPGLLFVSLVGAGWMIPKALDDALTDWRVASFKYLGLPVCGWLLRASVRTSPTVIKLFFLGNFCWMSAIVGMVYLDQPVRLCNAYLQDDQDWAGRGLIALAITLPLAWLVAEIKPVMRFLKR